MAKKSKIAKNEQRKVIVERYAEKRRELKKALVDPKGPTSRVKQPAKRCRSSLVTRAPLVSEAATRLTVDPVVCSANTAFPA
jgi:hypothetical protein